MLDKPIAIVDVETTGYSSKNSAITEIGVIVFDGAKIIEEFSSLVNPGRNINSAITRLTGIDNKMVADAPYFEDIADKVAGLFEGRYFMAHNVTFDFSFIRRQLQAAGYECNSRLLCSVKLSRSLYPNAKSHSLENVIKRHGLNVDDRHRAYDDAFAVHQFIHKASQDYGQEVVTEALKKQLKYKSLPPHLDESDFRHIDNSPGVYIFNDKNNVPVYIGKSVNMRTRVMSHFSQATKVSKELKISTSTHSVETIKTPGELEALLLESALIKKHKPLYNHMLRRTKSYIVARATKNAGGYKTIALDKIAPQDLTRDESLYAVHLNKTSAKASLVELQKKYLLCNKLLGLENTKKECFQYRLGRCLGACIKKESVKLYNLRLDVAFAYSKIKRWPYKGEIAIKTSSSSRIIVDDWMVKELINDESGPALPAYDYFDLDTYKILERYIRAHPESVLQAQ